MDYTRLVEARCARNPSLSSLHDFLSTPRSMAYAQRICAIDFFHCETEPVLREIASPGLAAELHCEKDVSSPKQLGQILFVENISRETICELGSSLAIDPMFFASYIHSAWRSMETPSPKVCQLPSQVKGQHFSTFWYHRSLVFPKLEDKDYKLLQQANVRRKVIVFPGNRGRRVGLAQHCCSLLVAPGRRSEWLGLVLVDPPMGDTFVSLRPKEQAVVVSTPSMPLFGGTEDFLYIESSHKRTASMLSELLHYWQAHRPDDFNPQGLTLRALSYYPLRIIAAEWVNYLSLMCIILQEHDQPPSGSAAAPKEDLDRIKAGLVSVSSWPRRVASSMTSLRRCTAFINHHAQLEGPSPSWLALREDYEHLVRSLVQQGKQLEAAVPIVTAYLQLAENRHAYLETKNVFRLTVLAFIFVPLSFVTGLFSMNPDVGPGGPHFWLYFAVAVPVLVFVLVVAKPAVLAV